MTVPTQLAPYLFKPGNPGKQRGMIHRQDRIAREMLERCFTDIGGYEAMVEWAKVNKTAFYTKLWSKFIVAAAESLEEEDKMELLKTMVFVHPVKTVEFERESAPTVEIEQESHPPASAPPTQDAGKVPPSPDLPPVGS